MDDQQPSNWELGRRLNDISGSLRELIGQREYGEYQRAIKDRLDGLDRAIEDVRRQHADDVEKLHMRITDEVKTAIARGQFRQTFTVSVVSAAAAIAAILLTIWLHGSGKA